MIGDKHPPTRHESWASPQDCVQSYFPADNVAARAILQQDTVMMGSCVAESHLKTQERRHAPPSWEPYAAPSEWNDE